MISKVVRCELAEFRPCFGLIVGGACPADSGERSMVGAGEPWLISERDAGLRPWIFLCSDCTWVVVRGGPPRGSVRPGPCRPFVLFAYVRAAETLSKYISTFGRCEPLLGSDERWVTSRPMTALPASRHRQLRVSIDRSTGCAIEFTPPGYAISTTLSLEDRTCLWICAARG